MNNNVVEKTLKSIDNIDRLSDLAAISIYNTSHEAIDKFDVMQEHATPEYVEGEFVQESLLTGVLIGAGIIGVAISAFLIIKKIIESKAKGDPNAAPNTVAGVNLLNPEEIKKLFDGWNDKYFKNHPDLVVEGVPGADVSELNTYNGLLLGSIRTFCDNATKMIDGLNELSDADMKEAIDNLNKEFDSNINMDELVSKTGRVDKNTILQIKAASEDISKTLREFDAQVTNCIKEFRNKEKNNQNSDSDNEENKISEENIKLLEKALKAKANTAGAIMDNFRNKCLNGIAQALDAKVKEAEGQAKAKQQQELTPLTDDDKQTIIKSCVNLIKSGYEYSDEDISHYVTTHHTASPEEIQEIINAVRAETNGSPKESTGGPGSGTNPSQDESTDAETETPTPETDEASAENSDKHEETTETSSDNQLNGETSESEKLTSSETPKRADKVNITPEMEEKMKEVLLSAGEISQYGVIDESVVNHEIRQIKDMGLFKWTRSQYGDPNNVMSEQQDRCIKINNARYDAACNLAEVMGIDPDLVPKPTPLEQAATHTETPEGTPEAEPTKTETPANETEKKDEASSENTKENSNSEGTSLFDDTQVTPEKIEKVVSTIESWDPDITLTKKDRKYIDWFLSANNKDTGISDIIDILEKRYKELLNSNESGKLLTFNKYLQMAMISADINGLNTEEITATFPQNRLDLLATKSEDIPSEGEKESTATPSETPDDGEKSNNNQATALNNNDILKTVADKYFDGNIDSTKDALEAFNGMPTTNIIRDCIKGSLNEYLVSGSGSLKETIQKYYDFYNEIFKDANLDIHLPDVPDFSDELVSKIKHIWNVKGGFLISTDFDHMIDAILHNSEEPLNQIDESQLKMGSSSETPEGTPETEPENQNTDEASAKTNETSNAQLFTEEEEDKLVNAVYAVTGLNRQFRQEIYNAVTDDGFAEAAKKLYANYADDANKLNQIHTTLIAMAKSIDKESEVPALPTTEATPTESETSAENQTPEQTETPSEVSTTEPQSPSYTAPGVVTDDEELKKIADDLGMPLDNFISAYDKVKEGNADYTESQMLTTVFNNQMAFNQFTLPAINEAIAKEYDKCKQVANAVHAPFDVEPITIDEATFEKLHAYFDQKNKSVSNMDTAKLIPGALADMVMDEMHSSETISPEASENTETRNKTISVDDPAYMEKFNEAFSKAPDDRKQGIIQSIKSVNGDLDTYLKRFYHGIDKLNDTPERKAKFKNGRYNSIKTLAGLVGYTEDLTAPDSPRSGS